MLLKNVLSFFTIILLFDCGLGEHNELSTTSGYYADYYTDADRLYQDELTANTTQEDSIQKLFDNYEKTYINTTWDNIDENEIVADKKSDKDEFLEIDTDLLSPTEHNIEKTSDDIIEEIYEIVNESEKHNKHTKDEFDIKEIVLASNINENSNKLQHDQLSYGHHLFQNKSAEKNYVHNSVKELNETTETIHTKVKENKEHVKKSKIIENQFSLKKVPKEIINDNIDESKKLDTEFNAIVIEETKDIQIPENDFHKIPTKHMYSDITPDKYDDTIFTSSKIKTEYPIDSIENINLKIPNTNTNEQTYYHDDMSAEILSINIPNPQTSNTNIDSLATVTSVTSSPGFLANVASLWLNATRNRNGVTPSPNPTVPPTANLGLIANVASLLRNATRIRLPTLVLTTQTPTTTTIPPATTPTTANPGLLSNLASIWRNSTGIGRTPTPTSNLQQTTTGGLLTNVASMLINSAGITPLPTNPQILPSALIQSTTTVPMVHSYPTDNVNLANAASEIREVISVPDLPVSLTEDASSLSSLTSNLITATGIRRVPALVSNTFSSVNTTFLPNLNPNIIRNSEILTNGDLIFINSTKTTPVTSIPAATNANFLSNAVSVLVDSTGIRNVLPTRNPNSATTNTSFFSNLTSALINSTGFRPVTDSPIIIPSTPRSNNVFSNVISILNQSIIPSVTPPPILNIQLENIDTNPKDTLTPNPAITNPPTLMSEIANILMGTIDTLITPVPKGQFRNLDDENTELMENDEDMVNSLEPRYISHKSKKPEEDHNVEQNFDETPLEAIEKIVDPEIREEFVKDIIVVQHSEPEENSKESQREEIIVEYKPEASDKIEVFVVKELHEDNLMYEQTTLKEVYNEHDETNVYIPTTQTSVQTEEHTHYHHKTKPTTTRGNYDSRMIENAKSFIPADVQKKNYDEIIANLSEINKPIFVNDQDFLIIESTTPKINTYVGKTHHPSVESPLHIKINTGGNSMLHKQDISITKYEEENLENTSSSTIKIPVSKEHMKSHDLWDSKEDTHSSSEEILLNIDSSEEEHLKELIDSDESGEFEIHVTPIMEPDLHHELESSQSHSNSQSSDSMHSISTSQSSVSSSTESKEQTVKLDVRIGSNEQMIESDDEHSGDGQISIEKIEHKIENPNYATVSHNIESTSHLPLTHFEEEQKKHKSTYGHSRSAETSRNYQTEVNHQIINSITIEKIPTIKYEQFITTETKPTTPSTGTVTPSTTTILHPIQTATSTGTTNLQLHVSENTKAASTTTTTESQLTTTTTTKPPVIFITSLNPTTEIFLEQEFKQFLKSPLTNIPKKKRGRNLEGFNSFSTNKDETKKIEEHIVIKKDGVQSHEIITDDIISEIVEFSTTTENPITETTTEIMTEILTEKSAIFDEILDFSDSQNNQIYLNSKKLLDEEKINVEKITESIDAIELIADNSKTILNSPILIEKSNLLLKVDNQIISSKNTRDLDEIRLANILAQEIQGDNNENIDNKMNEYWKNMGIIIGCLVIITILGLIIFIGIKKVRFYSGLDFIPV